MPARRPLPDTALADLARHAFLLGLEHGRERPAPISAGALMPLLGINHVIYRKKMRQVYGAGFDISQLHIGGK